MVTDHRHGSPQGTPRDRAIVTRTARINLATSGVSTLISPPGVGKKLIVHNVDMVDYSGVAAYLQLGFSESAPATAAAVAATTNPFQVQLPANGGEVLAGVDLEGLVNQGLYGGITSDPVACQGTIVYSIVPA